MVDTRAGQESEQDRESGATRRLEVLAAIAEQLNRYGAVEEILEASARLTCEVLAASAAWILIREDDDTFALAASHGLPTWTERGDREALVGGTCRCQRAALDGELPCAVNVVTCERAARSRFTRGLPRAHGSVPLSAGSEIVGILNLGFAQTRPLDEAELQLLAVVGQTIGMALQRARLVERQLTARTEWHRSLTRHATDLVVVVDGDGVIRHVSESLERLIGTRIDQYLGLTASEIFDPADRPAIARARETTTASPGLPVTVEARVADGTGAPRWLEITLTNLLDDPNVAGLVINARDVTERVHLREQLERLEQGRGGSELVSDEQRARALERREMERELRQALDADELRLLFQPAVALADGAVTSVEALVAWQHPTRGLLRAGSFVPLAEDSGLVNPLAEWVLREACTFAARLAAQRRPGPRVPVAVNLSVHQLANPGLVRTVIRILETTGTDPALLALEITESGLAADLDGAIEELRGLRSLGIRLIVDDFGTGYSSLVRLRQFAVDALKIDQSFVAGLGRVDADTAIVRSVIGLAQALGLEVIAEGVETPEQCAILDRLGCRFGQGFLWCEGLPADELLEWMRGSGQSSTGWSTVTM